MGEGKQKRGEGSEEGDEEVRIERFKGEMIKRVRLRRFEIFGREEKSTFVNFDICRNDDTLFFWHVNSKTFCLAIKTHECIG